MTTGMRGSSSEKWNPSWGNLKEQDDFEMTDTQEEMERSLHLKDIHTSNRSRKLDPNAREKEEMKKTIEFLQENLMRASSELSRYQLKYSPPPGGWNPEEWKKEVGLRDDDPSPPWLANLPLLAPLLRSYDERIDELQDEANSWKSQWESIQVQLKSLIEENRDLRSARRQNMEESIRISDNQALLSNSASVQERSELLERISLLTEENDVLMEQQSLFQDELSKAREETDRTTFQYSQLQEQFRELQNHFTHLKSNFEQVEEERNTLWEDTQALESANEKAHQLEAKLRQRLEQMQTEYKSSIQNANALQEELQGATSHVRQYQQSLRTVQEQKKNLEKELQTLKATSQQNAKQQQETHLRQLFELREALDAAREEYLGATEEWSKERQSLENQISSLQHQLEMAKKDVDDAQRKSQQLEIQCQNVLNDSQRQKAQWASERTDLQRQWENVHDKLQRQEKETSELVAQKAQQSARVEDLQRQLSALQREYDTFQDRTGRETAELSHHYDNQIRELEYQLDQALGAHQRSAQELQEVLTAQSEMRVKWKEESKGLVQRMERALQEMKEEKTEAERDCQSLAVQLQTTFLEKQQLQERENELQRTIQQLSSSSMAMEERYAILVDETESWHNEITRLREANERFAMERQQRQREMDELRQESATAREKAESLQREVNSQFAQLKQVKGALQIFTARVEQLQEDKMRLRKKLKERK